MSIVAEATCGEAERLQPFEIPERAAVRAGIQLKTGGANQAAALAFLGAFNSTRKAVVDGVGIWQCSS
jgi:hypothetical protein